MSVQLCASPTGSVGALEVFPAPTVASTNSQLNQVITEIKASSGSNLTTLNVLTVCVNSMKLVESFTSLTGDQKKNLVIQAFTTCINDICPNPLACQTMLSILPQFIDTAISLENGTMTISKAEETGVTCCFNICSTLMKSTAATGTETSS